MGVEKGDVMFVCGRPFLVTLSRKTGFCLAQSVLSRKTPELANIIKQVASMYHQAGFTASALMLMDGEFERFALCLRDGLKSTRL